MKSIRKTVALALSAIMIMGVFVGCNNGKEAKVQEDKPKVEAKKEEKTLLVYSGAGLKKPMEEIAKIFEKDNNVKIEYNYAGSAQLLSQLELSKKGDVFIVGSMDTYNSAKENGLVLDNKTVAYHTPVIAVPKGNPKNIKSLEDMAKEGVKVLLGDEKANAVGKTSQDIIKKNNLPGINNNAIAKTATVSEMVTPLKEGKGDAAIVTADSVYGNKDIETIKIPEDKNVDQILPIATVESSKEKELANKFVDFVSSKEGKSIFEKYGFKPVQ
ncbi:molybdate ABC transporter substrate-binding protein [Clostridium sp.]|uniref:molybdate ABC transporter substrate-binding protein n=1 Tax=Clostridium sp. TaxID=1506 RepID=UPI003463FF5D